MPRGESLESRDGEPDLSQEDSPDRHADRTFYHSISVHRDCSLEFGCTPRVRLYTCLEIFAYKHAGWVISVVSMCRDTTVLETLELELGQFLMFVCLFVFLETGTG